MIVTSWQKRIMITRSQLRLSWCGHLVPGANSPAGQGMQRSYERYSSRTWPFCQSNCTLVRPGQKNYKSYLFLSNYRRKRCSFVRVDLRAAMFSFPSCIVLDSSGRLFHDPSRYHAKHNVLNTSCRVIDKDVDINPVLYRTENKI